MKRILFSTITSVAAALILLACNGNSGNAQSAGLTQAQVQTMINSAVAPLTSEITALQTQVASLQGSSGAQPAVYITAPNATAYASRIMKLTRAATAASSAAPSAACTGIGTLTGRPDNSDPITSNLLAGVSCTGYYFTVTASTAGGESVIQPPLATSAVYFDAPSCAGNAYVSDSFSWNSVIGTTANALAQGFVVRVDPTNSDPNGTNAATYFYAPANATTATVNVASVWTQNGGCTEFADTAGGFVELLANVPSVTGIQSAPIPGPVLIAN